MKKLKNKIFINACISGGIGLVGCIVVYTLFPQLLCRVVQDVHASNLYQKQQMSVDENISYTECFVPQQYSYIKNIILHVVNAEQGKENGDMEDDDQFNLHANMELTDDLGRVLIKKKYTFLGMNEAFIEFPIEKWVIPGKSYKFKVTFTSNVKVYLTCGPADIGPDEHQVLEIDGEKSEKALYMEYVYGTYSKKLLLFWFCAFFSSFSLVVEGLQLLYSRIKRS